MVVRRVLATARDDRTRRTDRLIPSPAADAKICLEPLALVRRESARKSARARSTASRVWSP